MGYDVHGTETSLLCAKQYKLMEQWRLCCITGTLNCSVRSIKHKVFSWWYVQRFGTVWESTRYGVEFGG